MKNYLLMILVAGMFAACTKSGEISPVNLIGKWELSHRYGGNILPQDTTFQAGNGNILQFNADSSFKQYANGAVISSGSFHIHNGQLYFNTNAYNAQQFYDMVSVSGNLLTIKPILGDIATTQYLKIGN